MGDGLSKGLIMLGFASWLVWFMVLTAGVDAADRESITLHFKGRIDGSDRITIDHRLVTWQNVAWGRPTYPVSIGGVTWHLQTSPVLLTSQVLPSAVDFSTARLERIAGRDTVALERSSSGIVISLSDTPVGSDLYEFRVRFRPLRDHVMLTIRATIDGSDELRLSSDAATWKNRHWGSSSDVSLNGVPWNPARVPQLLNIGRTTFLREPVDFATAIVVEKRGRDLVNVESHADGLIVRFADSENGPGGYVVRILLRKAKRFARREL